VDSWRDALARSKESFVVVRGIVSTQQNVMRRLSARQSEKPFTDFSLEIKETYCGAATDVLQGTYRGGVDDAGRRFRTSSMPRELVTGKEYALLLMKVGSSPGALLVDSEWTVAAIGHDDYHFDSMSQDDLSSLREVCK
jgi:hypothetical protein